MPIITSIPKGYKNGFKELLTLKEKEFASIQEGLASASPVAFVEDLAANLADSAKLSAKLLDEIFSSVGALIPFLEEEEELEEVIADVLSISLKEELIQGEDADKFVERLKILLTNKRIFYASKAEDLIYEVGNLYISGKVITEVRPIFDLDVEKPPESALIMHTLHVHYQSQSMGPHQDIYFSLDSNDIQNLMYRLERATRKEESLKLTLGKSGMTNLNE